MCATVRRVWTGLKGKVSDRWWSQPDRRRLLALLLAVVVAETGYIFLASGGHWTRFPFMESRIDELAEGFRAGHLHLVREPSPDLLRRANPFDPANAGLWYWDASLYGGHFYFYWGPVPALLLALVKIVFRISRPLGDCPPFLGLVTLQLVAGALLIDRLVARLFRAATPVQVAGAVLILAFANPTPFMLARPAIYEAAIVGGQAFILFGLALAFEAVARADRPRGSTLCAAAAGAAFGLAIGCRSSLAPGLVLLSVAMAGFAARRVPRDRWRRLLATLIACGLPLGAAVFGLLAYNRLRFDHWLEFGQRYQLTWIAWRWSPAFIPANIYSFALRAADLSCHVPFVTAVTNMGAAAFPPGFHLAEGYFVYEPIIGSLISVPWIWLVPAAFLPTGWRLAAGAAGPGDNLRPAVVTLLFLAGTVTFAPVLYAPSATMRYMGDYTAPLVLLGSLGAWQLERLTQPRSAGRRALKAGVVTLALLTIATGFALGLTGYYGLFKVDNPALMSKLDAVLSVCGKGR